MRQSKNIESSLPLTGIILAAGASTRFGSPKQAVDIGGETMIALAVRRATSQCDAGVVVVAGANWDALIPVLDHLPARIIRNDQWQEGMGSSIRAAMKGIAENSSAVLLMLCDQPAVTRADLSRLTAAWRRMPGQIAAARYENCLGVPAIFPQPYWQQLHRLTGEVGAKQIILAAKAVSAVDIPAAALDVDTPEQLQRFTE